MSYGLRMHELTLIPQGRTGNNLFQIAAAYALCKRTGCKLFIDWRGWPSSQELVEKLHLDIPFKEAHGTLCDCRSLNFGVLPNPAGKYDCLRGWFQDPRYFSDAAQDIRKMFAPLTRERSKGSVGVHIRMGDYMSDQYSKDYFTLSAFDILTAYTALGRPGGDITLFSDSPKEAPYRMPFKDFTTDDSPDVLEALKRMTSCEYFIASNSTLSWWACWLGKIPFVAAHYPWTKFHNQDSLYESNWAIYH